MCLAWAKVSLAVRVESELLECWLTKEATTSHLLLVPAGNKLTALIRRASSSLVQGLVAEDFSLADAPLVAFSSNSSFSFSNFSLRLLTALMNTLFLSGTWRA